MILQKKLNANWMKKICKLCDRGWEIGAVYTRVIPTPISTNRIAQTIGNTILGGDKNGLLIVALYNSAPSFVSQPERAPTASVIIIQKVYVFHVRLFTFYHPNIKLCRCKLYIRNFSFQVQNKNGSSHKRTTVRLNFKFKIW